jgi:hypothetical protein
MRTIYKYKMEPGAACLRIKAPIIRLLSVQCQRSVICVWAEVDTEKEDREFVVYPIGTGWDLDMVELPENAIYWDTVQQFGGDLVWHIYYIEKNK